MSLCVKSCVQAGPVFGSCCRCLKVLFVCMYMCLGPCLLYVMSERESSFHTYKHAKLTYMHIRMVVSLIQ